MLVSTLYNFFASTKLAILLLSCLVAGAFAGTMLPQFSATFTYDVYNSWWFIFLLGLLSSNLIICSIERWPKLWNQLHPDPDELTRDHLQKWPHQAHWQVKDSNPFSLINLSAQLQSLGWKNQQPGITDQSCPVYQNGKYTRLGTLLVHSSILIILAGGAIGKIYGFKSTITLPEMEQISTIVSEDNTKHFDLGFTVRCDSFSMERYPSGTIKNYGSRLSFIENGDVVVTHNILVNSPCEHKGITFYQSDFEGYNSFIFSIVNNTSNNSTTLIAPFQKQTEWKSEGIRLGVINAELDNESVTRFKLWFTSDTTDPVQQWMADNSTIETTVGQTSYTIHAKQLYATGLQVSKDPGVPLVYTGFALLLAGLIVTFFMSHRRIAIYFDKNGQHYDVYLFGTSNKHSESFHKIFSKLAETLQE